MSYEQERRAASMRRVPLQALVEICGRDVGGAPAFEAESLDVSGRGMHVRTAYLPEIGSPLVCRFENGGNEIVVEGSVAWRNELERGGEFGIQFTALDSGSVEALKQLCCLLTPPPPEAAPSAQPEPREGDGSRVRLHIDGLGSPMKASVRGGGARQVQVASNLEFLKVGRHLEIEDVGAGERRGARIDGVDVVIDPQTQVPQLVVALRYDGVEEATPEPSVIDSDADPDAPELEPSAGFAAVGMASTGADGDFADAEMADGEDDVVEEAQAMRGKIANMAVEAGSAAKKGGAAIGMIGARAASGFGRMFKGAGAKMMELRKQKQADAPRRTTAPAPGGAMSAGQRKLRPQTGATAEAEPTEAPIDPAAKKKRMRKIAALSALGVLLLTVGVIAMKKPAAPPGAAAKDAPASVAVTAAPAGDVTSVDEQGNPVAAKNDKGDKGATGANAEVPLFGPTPMATMEPAPLGPSPGADEGDSAKDDGAGDDEEAKEKKAASAAVDDQVFGDDKSGDSDGDQKGDGSPWGNGKVNDPVVYRLHLDKAGKAIQGAVTATGFTVVIPGVKVMESAKSIMDRDSRIARVKTKNGTSGAEINFQFKDGIPGYRVRLKKDYVEFLISSAGKGGDAEKNASSTGGKHKKKKHGAKKAQVSPEKNAKKQSSGKKKTAKKKSKKKTG